MQKITNPCALWMIIFSCFYEKQILSSHFAFLIPILYLLSKVRVNIYISLMRMLTQRGLFTVKIPILKNTENEVEVTAKKTIAEIVFFLLKCESVRTVILMDDTMNEIMARLHLTDVSTRQFFFKWETMLDSKIFILEGSSCRGPNWDMFAMHHFL